MLRTRIIMYYFYAFLIGFCLSAIKRILNVLDNIRDFTDSLILARKEAEDEENTEILSQLTDSHLIQTITDIFRGKSYQRFNKPLCISNIK